MISQQAEDRTRLFARVLGPYLVIAMAVYVLRMPDLRALLGALDANPMVAWSTGAFTLLMGLVVVALHPLWSSPAAVLVSVLGWLTAVKGVAIMAFPGAYASLADRITNPLPIVIADAVLVGGIGLYLTYVGWGRVVRGHP